MISILQITTLIAVIYLIEILALKALTELLIAHIQPKYLIPLITLIASKVLIPLIST